MALPILSVLNLVPIHPWPCHPLGLLNMFYMNISKTGLSGYELTVKINSRLKWFVIVDGRNSNLSIRLLITKKRHGNRWLGLYLFSKAESQLINTRSSPRVRKTATLQNTTYCWHSTMNWIIYAVSMVAIPRHLQIYLTVLCQKHICSRKKCLGI